MNSIGLFLGKIWENPKRMKHAWMLVFCFLSPVLLFPTLIRSTIEWQKMYTIEEFDSWGKLWTFLAELQTAIPPLWAVVEIVIFRIFGSTWLFIKVAYILAFLLSVYFALKLCGDSKYRILVIGILSLIYLFAIRILHKGNPQLYDLYTPMLFLGWLLALKNAREEKNGVGLVLLAGLSLSVLELTRSFMFPLMPFLVVLSWISLNEKPIKFRLLFLLPILLFSGSWHVKQMVLHDQVHWSNHTGFNLQKVWGDLTEKKFVYQEEEGRLVKEYQNLNTDLHTKNNKALSKEMVAVIMQNPGKAVVRTAGSVIKFYAPKTDLYLANMTLLPQLVYRPSVWITALSLWAGFLILMTNLIRSLRTKQPWMSFGDPENILIIGTAAMSLLMSIGERGEEARFMISILPMLACFPGWKLHIGKWISQQQAAKI